jgi:LacI family transcriptional regulator
MRSPKLPHVTLTQIAKAAGMAISTVSYALRNDPKIPADTIAQIQEVAIRLGYRPNPRIAALMAHIRRARPVAKGERLAFVWMNPPPEDHHPTSRWLTGARRRAEQLGYVLEEFLLEVDGMTAGRLARILRARGITGVVLSPLIDRISFKIDWNWSAFSTAIIGNAVSIPELHHAGHHHFAAMRMTMLKLLERGYRRVAAIVDADINERSRRAWSAAFLEHHPTPVSARRWLAAPEPAEVAAAGRWLLQRKPEALVTTFPMLDRLNHAGFRPSRSTVVTLLDWHPNAEGYGGIDQCEEIVAASAVDLVVGQLHRNERGAPEHVQMLLSPGIWRDTGAL